MNIQKQSELENRSLDFMLAEYETLRSVRSGLMSLGESRANIFLLTVSGGLAGLAILYGSSGWEEIAAPIIGVVLAGLFLLGLITFARSIERNIGIKVYARGMNRIRQYFVQLYPNLSDYLILPVSDDRPAFKSMGWLPKGGRFLGLSSMVAVINSIVASVAVLGFCKGSCWITDQASYIASILAFLAVLFGQHIYMSIRLGKAEKETKVRFPSTSNS